MVSDRLQCATISSAIAGGLTQGPGLGVGMSLRLTGVSMVDGARAMAEMFSFLSSSARATVTAATAALDAVYAAMLAPWRGVSACRAEILMMCPPLLTPSGPPNRKLATAARQLSTQETRFMEICWCRTLAG